MHPINQKHLQIGRYIDAMDLLNTWCVGKVYKHLENNSIIVTFDGWTHK